MIKLSNSNNFSSEKFSGKLGIKPGAAFPSEYATQYPCAVHPPSPKNSNFFVDYLGQGMNMGSFGFGLFSLSIDHSEALDHSANVASVE